MKYTLGDVAVATLEYNNLADYNEFLTKDLKELEIENGQIINVDFSNLITNYTVYVAYRKYNWIPE